MLLSTFLFWAAAAADSAAACDQKNAQSVLGGPIDDAVCRVGALPMAPRGPVRWDGPHLCRAEADDRNVCVFFDRQHGVVLVGALAVADRVAAALSRPPLSSARQHLLPVPASPPFVVVDVPGKGRGARANRTVRHGEVVTVERPAMLVQREVVMAFAEEVGKRATTGPIRRLLDLAVQKLPAAQRRAVLRQAGDGAGAVLMANGFQVDVSGSEDGFLMGNFPAASRFNHDCQPNLAFHVDRDLTHVTRAVRDIAPGEELTIAYVDLLAPRAERQARLRDVWGFQCACARCRSAETGASSSSDARLHEIAQIEAQLGDLVASTALAAADADAAVARLLALYTAERLDAKIGGAYILAALQAAFSADEANTRRYAGLAADAVALESGPDAGDAAAMKQLAQQPRTHWSWGWRTG